MHRHEWEPSQCNTGNRTLEITNSKLEEMQENLSRWLKFVREVFIVNKRSKGLLEMNHQNHYIHHQVCCVIMWVSVGLCLQNTLETCNICSKPIMERILRATGKAYHPHCFTCVVCHRSLDGIPFTVDASNHIHCIEDFHKYVVYGGGGL